MSSLVLLYACAGGERRVWEITIPSHGNLKKVLKSLVPLQYKLLPASSIGYVYYTPACLSIFTIELRNPLTTAT